MMFPRDRYADFVEHPRYGREPRITGLNPDRNDRDVHLNTNSSGREVQAELPQQLPTWPFVLYSTNAHMVKTFGLRIPNTAIIADPDRQLPDTGFVTHYFDVEKLCRDCKRPFIFFAEEQKEWYEKLGRSLRVDCVRCAHCRKLQA